jgi:hypothetical protein
MTHTLVTLSAKGLTEVEVTEDVDVEELNPSRVDDGEEVDVVDLNADDASSSQASGNDDDED